MTYIETEREREVRLLYCNLMSETRRRLDFLEVLYEQATALSKKRTRLPPIAHGLRNRGAAPSSFGQPRFPKALNQQLRV